MPEVFSLFFFSHAAYETAVMGTKDRNNIHIFWHLAELPEPSKLQQMATTAK